MNLEQIKEMIPSFGRDIRLNLDSVLSQEGAPGLDLEQIAGVALACAYSVERLDLAKAIELHFQAQATAERVEAAKGAATIMAMNNVYYRFTHLNEDKEISKLPARLRMSIIGKPGVPKTEFELMSLAISAVEGCGMCVNAHVAELRKTGISTEGIQSAVRIGSVVKAAAVALSIA